MHVESFTIFRCLSHSCHRPPMCLPIFSFILELSFFTIALTADYEWLKLCSFVLFHFICSDSFLHLLFHIFWLFNVLNRESFLHVLPFFRFSQWLCIERICDSVDFFSSTSCYFYSQLRHLFKFFAAHRFANLLPFVICSLRSALAGIYLLLLFEDVSN